MNIVERTTSSIPAQSESGAIISMIERAARDPSIDIDKMERLIALQERALARQAESAFNDAMAAAQGEMLPVAADANNPQTRSKYATYYALDRALRPVYTKHGFSLSFNTEPGAPEGYVRIVCYVAAHGHTRKYQRDMPADGKGAKGGDVMTKTHAIGSAETYGQRYLLKGIFNIAVGGDDDGNAASRTAPIEYITDAQDTELKLLLSQRSDPEAALNKFLGIFRIESVADLPAREYQRAKNMLTRNQGQVQ